MLAKGTLTNSFSVYFDEMDRCREAGSYWALLHITVCLPDICAALQSQTGETTGQKYQAWCRQYAGDPSLTPAERWEMRNRVLHQGRARAIATGRYSGYAFGQPASSGAIDHKRYDGSLLHIDVGEFARETRSAVERWITHIESTPSSREALAVEQNLPSLVSVHTTPIVTIGGLFNFMKTN